MTYKLLDGGGSGGSTSHSYKCIEDNEQHCKVEVIASTLDNTVV